MVFEDAGQTEGLTIWRIEVVKCYFNMSSFRHFFNSRIFNLYFMRKLKSMESSTLETPILS